MQYNYQLNDTLAAWNLPKGMRKGGNVGGNGTLLPAPELIRCPITGRPGSPNTTSQEERGHPDTIGDVPVLNASRSLDSVWTTAGSPGNNIEAGGEDKNTPDNEEDKYKSDSEKSETTITYSEYEESCNEKKNKKEIRKDKKHIEDITIATLNIRGKNLEKDILGKKNKVEIIIDE